VVAACNIDADRAAGGRINREQIARCALHDDESLAVRCRIDAVRVEAANLHVVATEGDDFNIPHSRQAAAGSERKSV